MKDFRGMKRQRSRNRKPSGNQNNPNRAYESNGPRRHQGARQRAGPSTKSTSSWPATPIPRATGSWPKNSPAARGALFPHDPPDAAPAAGVGIRPARSVPPRASISITTTTAKTKAMTARPKGRDGEAEGAMGGDEPQPGLDEPRYDNRDNRQDRNRQNGNGNGNGNNGYNRTNGERDRQNGRDNNRQDRPNGEPRSFEPRHNNNNNGGGNRQNGEAPERIEYDENGNRRETRRERYERRRQQRLAEQEQNLAVIQPACSPSLPRPSPWRPAPRPSPKWPSAPAAREKPVPQGRRTFCRPSSARPLRWLPRRNRWLTPTNRSRPKRCRPKRKAEDRRRRRGRLKQQSLRFPEAFLSVDALVDRPALRRFRRQGLRRRRRRRSAAKTPAGRPPHAVLDQRLDLVRASPRHRSAARASGPRACRAPRRRTADRHNRVWTPHACGRGAPFQQVFGLRPWPSAPRPANRRPSRYGPAAP